MFSVDQTYLRLVMLLTITDI